MLNLAAAAIVLLALHTLPSTPLRPWAMEALGKKVYLGLFGLASAGALVWLVTAFDAAPAIEPLWVTSGPWRYLSAAVMLFAFILLVAGLTTPNPSTLGQGRKPEGFEAWRGINAVTRHPVLWAIGIWGILHLINQPDAATLLFFGTFALLAINGAKLQELRKRRMFGEAWRAFEAHTSFVSFAAILEGRAKLRLRDIPYWRIAAGLALWAAVISTHGALFGVPAL